MSNRYTVSQAIVGLTCRSNGTRTFIDGVEVQEVTSLVVGNKLEVSANFLPASEGHRRVLAAILSLRQVTIELVTTDIEHTSMYFSGRLLGQVKFPLNDVVKLSFSMQLGADEPDSADDGPEVGIIKRERNFFTEQLIRDIFLTQREQDYLDGHTYHYSEPAGGGFTLVTEE